MHSKQLMAKCRIKPKKKLQFESHRRRALLEHFLSHSRIRCVDVWTEWMSAGVVEAIMCLFYVPMSRCSVAGWGTAHSKVICSFCPILAKLLGACHLPRPTEECWWVASSWRRGSGGPRSECSSSPASNFLLKEASVFTSHYSGPPLLPSPPPSYEMPLEKLFW